MNKLSALLMLLCFCNAQLISSAIPINIQAAISLQIDTDHLELSKDNANVWLRLGLLLSSRHPGTRATTAPVAQPTATTTSVPPTVATTATPLALPIVATTTTTTALPTVATTATTTALPPSACKAEFIGVGEHCYHFSRDRATFDDASHACHSLGAALAHPNNTQDNSRLAQYLKQNKPSTNHWWMGATDKDTEGQWVWTHNGSPVGNTDWFSGQALQPDNSFENEHCAVYESDFNNKWNDIPCESKFQYICQQDSADDDTVQRQYIAPVKSEGMTTTLTLNVSKSDLVQLRDHRYYFSTSTASFEEAKKACQSIDTTLAHPQNAKDNSLIKEYVRKHRDTDNGWWIGATDRDSEGQWVWAHDKSPLGYSDWSRGEPNDTFENEDCVHLRRDRDDKWDDAPCGNKYNYICQYDDSNVDGRGVPNGEVEASGDDVDTPDFH